MREKSEHEHVREKECNDCDSIMTWSISCEGSIKIRSSVSFLTVSLPPLPVSFYLSLLHMSSFP